jgi:purine-nucleoside phosphorylase
MSLHLAANAGAIAETVLMPGDPLRAKWIAEHFLEEVVCYNEIRGMLGFTGTYKGQKVSVQGSGMGIPSALIYYHELIADYGVKRIIRTGTAGALQPNLELRDLVLAVSASTNSSLNKTLFPYADFAPTAHAGLLLRAMDYVRAQNMPFHAGNVLTSDQFYSADPKFYEPWKQHGVLCVEMETAGLYSLAARHRVEALAVLTISDSLITGKQTNAEDREQSFTTMVELALNLL